MPIPFDDVRFLGGSSNRGAVLTALTGGPLSRDELLERVDASRVTLRRILGDLEDRGWVERDAAGFRTTATGAIIASEYERFLDTIRATSRLSGAMTWLPTESLGFDIWRLADARVTLPDDNTHVAPVSRVDRLIRDADDSRILSHGVSISTVTANREAVVESGQRFAVVLPEPAVQYIQEHPSLSATFREILETGHATAYVTPESPPEMMVALLDGVAVFGLLGEGLPRGVVESEDEVVCRWARETFETWRGGADRLDESAFEA